MTNKQVFKTIFIDQDKKVVHTSDFLYKVPFKIGQELWFNQRPYIYVDGTSESDGQNVTQRLYLKEK